MPFSYIDSPARNSALGRLNGGEGDGMLGLHPANKLVRAVASLVAPIVLGLISFSAMPAQDLPDWQTKAGSKMAFEVASIKPSQGVFVPSNVALTPWDDYSPTNGRFRGDATLSTYIQFAYKLWPNEMQSRELSRLPQWVSTDHYSVEARAASTNPTKDQVRLMVQSLLAERFRLAAHFEAREVPVFELMLAQPGKPGPRLVPHADGPPCDKPGTSPGEGLPGFPGDCHSLSAIDKPGAIPGSMLVVVGSRDISTDVLAGALSILPLGVGRPVIDKTGLAGRFDFTLEWAREPRAPAASEAPPPAPSGPTPIGALRDQLGLKLAPSKASLPILFIDKVERPSDN
jgi:bla regulator protein blaR1